MEIFLIPIQHFKLINGGKVKESLYITSLGPFLSFMFHFISFHFLPMRFNVDTSYSGKVYFRQLAARNERKVKTKCFEGIQKATETVKKKQKKREEENFSTLVTFTLDAAYTRARSEEKVKD